MPRPDQYISWPDWAVSLAEEMAPKRMRLQAFLAECKARGHDPSPYADYQLQGLIGRAAKRTLKGRVPGPVLEPKLSRIDSVESDPRVVQARRALEEIRKLVGQELDQERRRSAIVDQIRRLQDELALIAPTPTGRPERPLPAPETPQTTIGQAITVSVPSAKSVDFGPKPLLGSEILEAMGKKPKVGPVPGDGINWNQLSDRATPVTLRVTGSEELRRMVSGETGPIADAIEIAYSEALEARDELNVWRDLATQKQLIGSIAVHTGVPARPHNRAGVWTCGGHETAR